MNILKTGKNVKHICINNSRYYLEDMLPIGPDRVKTPIRGMESIEYGDERYEQPIDLLVFDMSLSIKNLQHVEIAHVKLLNTFFENPDDFEYLKLDHVETVMVGDYGRI
jgi:hypothetical protein